MTEYLSNKLRVLSFLSIVLVVILHANLFEYSLGFNFFLQKLMTNEVTRIAVPLFYAISGYLLFCKLNFFSMNWYITKLKIRCKTLVVPFLLWSLIGFCIVYGTKLFMPSSFASAGVLADYDLGDYLIAFFWKPVGTHQFWFIRDLFVCVLVCPFIYCGLKYLREFFLLIISTMWFCSIQYLISIEAVMFVSLGAYFAIFRKQVLEYVQQGKSVAFISGMVFLLACYTDLSFSYGYYLRCIVILSGMAFLWSIYDEYYHCFFSKFIGFRPINYTFFIFAFHEPMLTFIKGVFLQITDTQIGIFIIYLISPILCILTCLIVGYSLKRIFPMVYSVLCGARG